MFRPSRGILILGLAVLLAVLLSFSFLSNALALTGPNNYTKNDPAAKWNCFEKDSNGNLIVNKTTGYLEPCPIDTGDNAWMLTSAALVLMMTPGGLAIFYSGLTRQKNAVNTLMMVFITTGIIAIQWVFWGYSLAFGPDATGNGFIGTLDWAGLRGVLHDVPSDVYGGLGG
ncbi:MAG: ammonium transporter, partial [Nitrososphaeraceae archaeon]